MEDFSACAEVCHAFDQPAHDQIPQVEPGLVCFGCIRAVAKLSLASVSSHRAGIGFGSLARLS